MSDTKILSGEELANWRTESDVYYARTRISDSHAAQAQRIEELEAGLIHEKLSHQFTEKQRDAALLRAEAAEAQVKALLEALPVISALRMAKEQLVPGARDALRAYAVAAKPKER